MTLRTYAVEVGVALTRPPKVDEYRSYRVLASSTWEAELIATQWASCTCVMPRDVVGGSV